MPRRIQMHRRKGGWRKDHLDAVIVARPSKWGNPFALDGPLDLFAWLSLAGERGDRTMREWRRDACAEAFRLMMTAERRAIPTDEVTDLDRAMALRPDAYPTHDEIRAELCGRDLACWCPLDAPCHADVLMEIANAD